MIEKTTENLYGVDSRKTLYFVVIANCSYAGLFAESESIHRSDCKYGYDKVNKEFGPNIDDSVDLTHHYNNF